MKLTERQLRLMIRKIIKEQVIGYTPPQKAAGDDEDYIDDGTVSAPAKMGSQEETQAADDSIKSLTQKRQTALDGGDSVKANSLGRQLAALRKSKG